jgi:hypothetical protein
MAPRADHQMTFLPDESRLARRRYCSGAGTPTLA